MKTKNPKTLQLVKKTIAQLDLKSKEQIVGGSSAFCESVAFTVCQFH